MSKALSLKLKEDIFENVEEITKKIKIPRNTYINFALEYYNKLNERKLLKKQLKKESKLVKESSLEILVDFEKMDDVILE
ncbi:MAG: hypothetical protein U9N76_03385 [Candidatus Marinimicrobia bacterium]|nr:hypothetical protein [Candidatus Neomarinimicrobiota bacterium]